MMTVASGSSTGTGRSPEKLRGLVSASTTQDGSVDHGVHEHETSASESRPRCLAIVPAFNERAAIASVIADLRALSWIDIVVIDDGSGDGTAAEAVRAGARVVTLPFNLGIGTAVQTGYLIAQDAGYDVAIQVDGDGQHPASEIAIACRRAAGRRRRSRDRIALPREEDIPLHRRSPYRHRRPRACSFRWPSGTR